MFMHLYNGLRGYVLGFLVLLVGCDSYSDNWYGTRGMDSWCGDMLCDWQLERGETARITTWHEKEYALLLRGGETQVSHLSKAAPLRCMDLRTTLKVDKGAKLTLQLDFNDDGVIEFERELSAQAWQQYFFAFVPPPDYKSVRYILRKSGQGEAAVAKFGLDEVWRSRCYTNATPVFIPVGGVCTTDASCSTGLCTLGICSACGDASTAPQTDAKRALLLCEEGAECSTDAQCEGGICSGGLCQSCARDGSCPAFARCSDDAQCQSGACVPRLSFSDVQEATSCLHCESDLDCGGKCVKGACETCSLDPYPRQCAECTSDTQCESGHCSFGVCSGCLDDAQCADGELCRFTDRFDVTKRECTAKLPKDLPRAALCEADSECEEGLKCGGSKGEPKRCGIACELDPRVCGKDQLCTRPGLHEFEGFVHLPQYPTPAFEKTEGRIATCHDKLWSEDAVGEAACSFHAECLPGLCCEGVCVSLKEGTPNYRTGGCDPALPSYYYE